jgi:nucleotide-binding universal stress UspA family protein
MYNTILLAVALQNWERYSAHALAAREVAATLAQGVANPLHVLSVYEYENPSLSGLSPDMAVRHREDMLRRTDNLMARRLDEFIAPLKEAGMAVQTSLRVGNPREMIVQVALSVMADILIIGSHSKRGVFDVALGGTARQIISRAPCTVLLVSPTTQGTK